MDSLEFVRGQLRVTRRNLREIADGAGVGHSWLRMFARGEIPDPGYSRVKALADYFMRVGVEPVPLVSDLPTPPTQQAAWDGQERRQQQAGSIHDRKRQAA